MNLISRGVVDGEYTFLGCLTTQPDKLPLCRKEHTQVPVANFVEQVANHLSAEDVFETFG